MRNTTPIKTSTHKGTDLFKKNTERSCYYFQADKKTHTSYLRYFPTPFSLPPKTKWNMVWKKVVLESNVFTRHRDYVLSIGRALLHGQSHVTFLITGLSIYIISCKCTCTLYLWSLSRVLQFDISKRRNHMSTSPRCLWHTLGVQEDKVVPCPQNVVVTHTDNHQKETEGFL